MNRNAWLWRIRLPLAMALLCAVALVNASPAAAVFFGPSPGEGIATMPVAPESVWVNLDHDSIELDQITFAWASVYPEWSNSSVTWSSSDESIATVDRYSGVITPVSLGRVAIIATSVDFTNGSVSDSAMLTVAPTLVDEIDVRWEDGYDSWDARLAVGESMGAYVLGYSPSNATNGSVTWSTSDDSVISVDSEGNVTGLSNGSAYVYANAVDGGEARGDAYVTVYTPVSQVWVYYGEGSGTARIKDSETLTAYASVNPSNASTQEVTWSWRSDSSAYYATIDSATGQIVPIPGSFYGSVHLHPMATVVGGGLDGADVSNPYYDGNYACVDIYQTYITDISVNLSDYSIFMGGTSQASAVVYPENASFRTYEWSSSDPSVATVDSEGVITSVGVGYANITATATDGSGISSYQTIEVQPIMVESLDISWDGEGGETAKLWRGDSAQMQGVSIAPQNATYQTLNWRSSDDSVAVVDENGYVTAVGNGYTWITAYTTDGSELWDSVEVYVSTYVDSVEVYGDDEWYEISLKDSETAYAYANIYPSDASFTDVVWSFWSESDYQYASIDSVSGLITPIQGSFEGYVHIHAKATVEGAGRYGEHVYDTECVDIYQTMVESVDVTLDDYTITYGGSGTSAYASLYPENAANRSYSWSSSDESVATVNDNGTVTAVGGGEADIIATATDGSGVYGSATITVTELVSSVAISADPVMERGTSQFATAEVGRASATDRSVYWFSTDSDVISVNPETGELTAVGKGSAWVYAFANDDSFAADAVLIDVVASVTDLDVSLSDYDITTRDTSQANAALTPVDPTVDSIRWSTSDADVATVDSKTGLVTPVGVGEADIIAEAMDGSGVSDYATITVSPILAESISISVDDNDIGVSESTLAVATVMPEDATDKSVVWASSNESIATVDDNGLVTGIAEGYVVLSATAADGSEVVCYTQVYVHNILIESLKLNVEPSTIPVGGSGEGSAYVYPENATDKSYFWTSADPSIATVDPSSGVVTGVSAGEVRIIVTANDRGGVARSVWVTITADSPVESISVELDPAEVTVGEPSQATATVMPLDAWSKSVIWSSSDESIATVGSGGEITTLSSGEVTITATSASYDKRYTSVATPMMQEIVGYATLTVNPLPPVLAESIVVSVADNTLTAGDSTQASALVLPATTSDKSVVWTSSDDAVAKVDIDGMVTAVAEGQVTITATASDGSGAMDSETITVYAKPAAMVIATPWLSVITPHPGTKFYIRSTMSPAHNAGTAGVYAKIQRKRADGTWSSISSVRLGTYYSTVDRSIIRGIATVPSRGTYRVRLSYAGSPAYVTAWKTFTAK